MGHPSTVLVGFEVHKKTPAIAYVGERMRASSLLNCDVRQGC